MVDTLHIEKCKAIIRKYKSKHWQQTHKLGIKIYKSFPEALDIDKQNSNHIWRVSINTEMPKIENEVDKYDGDPSTLIVYQKITGHMISNVKMGLNLLLKARVTDYGHRAETPSSITYITAVF